MWINKRHHLPCVGSTQDYAKAQTHDLAEGVMMAYTTDHQTHGYGTGKKKWYSSQAQNLTLSFSFIVDAIYARAREQEYRNLPQVAAWAVCLSLKELGIQPQIKWPNDVLVESKKIAGVLAESVRLEHGSYAFHVGIGLNVNMESEESSKIDQPVTSLKILTQQDWDREQVFLTLEQHFSASMALFFRQGFAVFEHAINTHLAYCNQWISFARFSATGTDLIKAKLDKISAQGGLHLVLADGSEEIFFNGHIISLSTP